MTLAASIRPDKSVENELFDTPERLVGDSGAQAHDKRVDVLDELSKRAKIDDKNRAF